MRTDITPPTGAVQNSLNSIEAGIASHIKRFETGQTKERKNPILAASFVVLMDGGFDRKR